jgi:hypothetical protein
LSIPILVIALLLGANGVAAAATHAPTSHRSVVRRSATSGPGAKNLIVTPAVRKSLLDADAKAHSYPVADYRGLAPGETYYAFDEQNDRYYAAAGLVANSRSLGAQVSTQDDGGFNLFYRSKNSSTWKVFDDGLGGAEGSTCPIVIPLAVRQVWNWTMHPCYPNTPS